MTDIILSSDITVPDSHKFLPIFDVTNPRSLINLMPPEWRAAAVRVPIELLSCTQKELELKVKKFVYSKSNSQLVRLPIFLRHAKIRFWDEYDRVQDSGDDVMNLNAAFQGYLSEMEAAKILYSDATVAWIISGMPSYVAFIKDIHAMGLQRQLEVMQIKVDKAKPNIGLINAQYRIFARIDDRLHGAITQNHSIEQKSLNVNIEGKQSAAITANQDRLSLKDIERRIEELQKRSKLLEIPASVKLDDHKIITGEIMKLDGRAQKNTSGLAEANEEDKP